MRFIENGPSIPDELLNARDEGRVVFFCGAGVSQARAGLPDFFGLAEAVIRELGVSEDSDARKVLDKARAIGDELSVTGLISADRVFGLLEREFTPADIQAAVARSLAPKAEPDLSAHQLLLRLAKTPDSKTQLVTTNFDRLFERCDTTLAFYQPPRLPNPSRYDDLDGIVYLHGRVNDDYTGAHESGFVLSSSDFGYAYLSEGWATGFFREIVRGYVVAFVGYSADDPPIHYLLEGFRRTQGSSRQIYAFQAEESDEAVARWHHKGVEVIPYAQADGHRALWETLERWAQRADDPAAWVRATIDLAIKGPETLLPHQRGQVAHIVSTYGGAREFADRSPPAEWLCVFDPLCRYARPERTGWFDSDSPVVDPFVLYGLDSDVTPERDDPSHQMATRDIPSGAWDAFLANNLDCQSLSRENFSAVRGHYSTHIPRLPKRLGCLGAWVASIADQPAAVWWAARQEFLHPGILEGIEWRLDRVHEQLSPVILKAWRYLLEARQRIHHESRREWYELKHNIDREGWGPAAVRQFTTITCPYLKAGPALMARLVPPRTDARFRLWDLVRLEVECPVPPHDADIPDKWLGHVVRGLRKNIELAVRLCEEVDDMHRFHISPIVPEDRPDISDYGRTHDLSGCIIRFASLFERLIQLDVSKARHEYSAWPKDDDTAFSRLRFWAAGKPELATPDGFYQIVKGLSDEAFWSHDHQRDLLIVLAKRWGEVSEESRKQIENRLLEGPPRWEGEEDESYAERRTWATLERLRWLTDHNCGFSFDLEKEIAKRRPSAPKWKPEYAKHAADSREMRGGWVATNTGHIGLLREPIDSILARARESSGRTEGNFLEERDPFAGLCAERPVRAYLALAHAARRNDYPEWAWKTFLLSSGRKNDKARFSATIAERLCRLPGNTLIGLLYTSTSWLQDIGKPLSKEYPASFDKAISRLIDILHQAPAEGRSAVIGTSRGRDWVMEAINSPAGHIARAILEDSRVEAIDGDVDSPASWLRQLASLLALSGGPRRYAITIISHDLGWFHQLVPEWTEHHLLSILDAENQEDREALWAGFLWNARVTSPAFYLRLKPAMLTLVKEKNPSREGHVQSLAYLMLLGWIAPGATKEGRWISNAEFRDVLLHGGDEFRSQILWQLERGLEDNDESSHRKWLARAAEFFQDVWPRQRAVKNPTMSVRLCELLLSNSDTFPELVDFVLPFLTKITRGVGLLHLRSEASDIFDKHAKRLLTLLHAVLPDDVSSWPYGIGDVLEKIGTTDSELLSDTRLQELKRKWNAR
jgi:hypothetical protein